MFDLIIIGGGPAGSSAAVYAARKKIKTLMLVEAFGGQSAVSSEIYNWIGSPAISGNDLAKSFENHVKSYVGEDLMLETGIRAEHMTKEIDGSFTVKTNNGKEFHSRAILITSGSSRRKLTVPGADQYEHKGITYCASCDGPLFSGRDVAIIGGGNAGFETAIQLLAYTKSVTLLHKNAEFKADAVTVEKVLKDPKITALLNVEPVRVEGSLFVEKLIYRNKDTNEEISLPVQGIFVEIGAIPATEFAKDIVTLDELGRIVIDHKNQATSTEGIWAAGDCTTGLYHQNNIAAGDAIKALEGIHLWLHRSK